MIGWLVGREHSRAVLASRPDCQGGQLMPEAEEKPMKIHVEMEMTPEEARRLMGLPDVTKMQEEFAAEMQKRMRAAMNTLDPEAMLKAWLPMGGAGIEQLQRFFWDSAQRAATGTNRTTTKD
jgi:hypothetical protein